MDDNHPSSSSSDYLHQRATECEATPDGQCTMASASQTRRKLSASFVNVPASTSQLDYNHDINSHHLHSTPSRIPVLPSTLSSRVTPPTLLTRTELPLARSGRSPLPSITSATFSTVSSRFMAHSSPNGPQASPCFLTTPRPAGHVVSPPMAWETRIASASPELHRVEYPSDPSVPHPGSSFEDTITAETDAPVALGRKRGRAKSLPSTSPSRKRSRSGESIGMVASSLCSPAAPVKPASSEPTTVAVEDSVSQEDQGTRTHCRTRSTPLCRTSPLTSSIPAPPSQQQSSGITLCGRRLDVTEHTPLLLPPITLPSLSELEAHELLKGVQVRHDLQFEDVAIRSPTASTKRALQRVRMHIDGADVSPPSIARANQYHYSVMYWQTVEIEVLTGCRCVTWQVRHEDRPGELGLIMQFRRSSGCVCGGWMPGVDAETWRRRVGSSPYPSRFMEMLTQLRLILVALMGSTIRSPGPMPYSDSEAVAAELQRQQDAHTAANLVQNLLASVDPKHLSDQVRHGALGIELFAAIGEAMKHHCAPARDSMVDEMVRYGSTGHIGLGFQRIFECAEAMKVDIVNHHLHQYRPAIVQIGPELERTTLRHLLRNNFLERSDTRTWLREASKRVIASAPQSDRLHLMGRCVCPSSSELAVRSVIDGFVDLVFTHWDASIDIPLWPTSAVTAVQPASYPSTDPEVFRMDASRIRRFIAIAFDIYNTSMILHFFRSLFARRHPGLSQPELATQVEGARVDLEILQQETCATGTLPDTSSPAEWSLTLAKRIVCPPELDIDIEERLNTLPTVSAEDAADIRQIALQLESLRPSKPARETARKRLRALLAQLLYGAVIANVDGGIPSTARCKTLQTVRPSLVETAKTGPSIALGNMQARQAETNPATASMDDEDQAIAKAGFTTVSDRVRDLVTRMEPIVTLNVRSFKDFYGLKGMLAGSGEPTEDEMRASQQWRRDYDSHANDGRVWAGPSPFASHHQ